MSRITRDRDGSPPGSVTFDGPVLVLTEGEDDALLLIAIAAARGISNLQVHVMGGKDTRWGAKLKFIVEHPSYRANVGAIGLLRDADSDPDAAFQSCVSALTAAGLPTPGAPAEVVRTQDNAVSVFIVPDASSTGTIEDLVLATGDPDRLDCVDRYMTCLTDKGVPTPSNAAKGRMQAYLAGLSPSPKTLAVAAQKDLFDWNSAEFDPLGAWASELADGVGTH
jgi:hypothetical protein